MEQKTNKEIANELTNLVNNMCFDYKGVANELSNQHRTLQANFTRLCVSWLERCAELDKEGWFDLRNEDAVKLGTEFMEKISERSRYISNV